MFFDFDYLVAESLFENADLFRMTNKMNKLNLSFQINEWQLKKKKLFSNLDFNFEAHFLTIELMMMLKLILFQ